MATQNRYNDSKASTRLAGDKNLTSGKFRETSTSLKDYNYTVDGLVKELGTNKELLGTSWNVLGVPSAKYKSSKNPYAKLQRWQSGV